VISSEDPNGWSPVSIAEPEAVDEAVRRFRPDEIYYLAAHHRSSEACEEAPGAELLAGLKVNVTGLVHFLEAMRLHAPRARLFYASSSLIYGVRNVDERQDESTASSPACAYGLMKALGMQACRSYRDRGLFACAGILYNHESAYRPPGFLTQKVIRAALRIGGGSPEKLALGDLDAIVDWSYAPDFIDAFVRILDLDGPRDFIVSSGEGHTVREFVSIAFEHVGLDWREHVTVAPGTLTRRASVRIGDPRRLRQETGWCPSMDFSALVARLIEDTRAQMP
jgi:GDPmannose 4,6-dehydratase